MQTINKWRNSLFCFRFSIIFVFVWLAVSSTISLISYFFLSSAENAGDFIISFSTWFFVIPSIAFFGLINTIPMLIDWVQKPLVLAQAEKQKNLRKNNPNNTTDFNLN